jgi:hypothetical protein
MAQAPSSAITAPHKRGLLRRVSLFLLIVFLLPLATHAAWHWHRGWAPSWSTADWSSTGMLPPAPSKPEAMIHVYAARVGNWRGIFAHHSWIVIKDAGAPRYRRYDVVGWGRPVRENGWAADGRWYSNAPVLLHAVEGPASAALIARVDAAIASYPYNAFGDYSAWPGPNSNTFVQHVLRAVPELQFALPPTALGKDFRTDGGVAGITPSGTGFQLSLRGYAGLTVAWVEGIELNLLGLVAGVDLRRPAIKLPGWGRIGV